MLPNDVNKIEEYKRRLSERAVGNKHSLGMVRTKEHKESIAIANTLRCKGKPTWSSTHKEEMAKIMRGSNNPAWKGGVTKLKYESRDRMGSVELSNKLSKLRVGELNGSWKGGLTPINKLIRGGLKIKRWRTSVFERDIYTCQMPGCDKINKYLNAHHIKRFSDFPELRTDIDNGITLCNKCHNKTKGKEKDFEKVLTDIVMYDRNSTSYQSPT